MGHLRVGMRPRVVLAVLEEGESVSFSAGPGSSRRSSVKAREPLLISTNDFECTREEKKSRKRGVGVSQT